MESSLNRRRLFGLIVATPLAAGLPGIEALVAVAEPKMMKAAASSLTLASWDEQFFVEYLKGVGPSLHG